MERGISFSEVVGASAGSIIAVFIAAGATPEQLEKIIKDLDFKKFLKKPDKIKLKKSKLLSNFGFVLPKQYKFLPTIVNNLGIYNSKYIEDFIDQNLRKILNKNERVKFSDLIIPCSLIVADLSRNDSKIYSSSLTPDDDVARAVRSSSNIPIFFQPVDLKYVDGGMLSNLPVHLFRNKNKFHSKILAFAFNSEKITLTIKKFKDYGEALINTMLLGNLNIQLSLSNNVHYIYIDSNNIKATDFDKIDEENIDILISKGRDAVDEFVTNEMARINTKNTRSDVNMDYFDTNNIIAYTNNEIIEEIIISDTQTEFVYELFPTLIKWVSNGTKIKVLLKSNNDDVKHGDYRQRFLDHIGADIIKVDNIPFTGMVFDGHNEDKAKAIVLNNAKKSEQIYHSKYYYGKEDRDVISILYEKLNSNFKGKPKGINVSFKQSSREDLFKRLKKVRQYELSNVQFEFKVIKIEDLTFITKYVRGFKFRQIQNIFDIYEKNNIELFEPIEVHLKNGKSTMMTPPIIESIGNDKFVIEGNTRLTYLFKLGVKAVKVVIVKNVQEELPSSGRYKCNEVLIQIKRPKAKIGTINLTMINLGKLRRQ